MGLGELQASPFPDVLFPPLLLPALSSSPFHCALQDGFGMVILLLVLGTDLLVGSKVFVRDA